MQFEGSLDQAAVDAGMADEIGTFEGTLAKLAAGNATARRSPALKSPAPPVGMPVAPISAATVLAPAPTLPPAPVVPPEVIAERVRVLAIRAAAPAGADPARARAIANGESVEAFRETLAVREVERMLHWMRGGSKD